MRLNRVLRLLCLAALVLLTAGCARRSETQAVILITPAPTEPAPSAAPANPANSGVVVLEGKSLNVGYVATQGSSLHPLRTQSRDLCSLDRLVFESVIDLDENREPVSQLCGRWEYIGEDKAWYFYLRDGVVFHDGSPLTAYDVVASYEDILINSETSPYYARVRYLSDMQAVDTLTVKVTPGSFGYMTLYAMTFPVVQRDSLNAAYPKGTGPYWFTSFNNWGLMVLERNPLWWRRQSEIPRIVCKRYNEVSDAMEAFTTGEIDMLATRSTSAALSRQLSDRTTMDYTTLTWECLVPDLRGSILSDRAVREALMYAIDRTSLASTVYLGMAQESEVPVIPGSWLYETQSARYNYSPEHALQLLYDAGWIDSNGDGVLDRVKDGLWEDLAFEIITYDEPTTSSRSKAAQLIADQLARIGIRVSVNNTTRSKVLKAFNSEDDFGLALVGFNLSTMPDLSYLLSSNGNGNCSHYESEKMDDALKRARQALSADELRAQLSDIQLLVVDDLPVMGLFFRTGTLVSRLNLGGLSGIREDYILRGAEYLSLD
ncbi:MAG: peptide ABC transporter substrate-binding protein [Clostridia bacterium]|nr:peptide ABC transporter substrate-binding protein [Clostridia bacterium]